MPTGAILGRLALVGATVALCLGAFEGGARLVLGPPAATYFTPAYRDVETDFDVQYAANPDGSRATACSPPGAAAPVVVLGDSFAFGQGVPQGEDLASRLACDSGRPVRNLGSIGQDFVYYEAALAGMIPADAQAVILLLYENDLPPPGWNGAGWRLKRAIYKRSHLVLAARKAIREAKNLMHRGEIASFTVEGRMNNPKTVVSTDPGFFRDLATPDPARLESLRQAVKDAVAQARQAAPQARVLVALAPEASTVSNGHRDFYRSLGDVTLPEFGRPTILYETARQACAEAEGCRFVDLFPALAEQGEAAYFPHDFHWNPAGARLAAGLLRRELAR